MSGEKSGGLTKERMPGWNAALKPSNPSGSSLTSTLPNRSKALLRLYMADFDSSGIPLCLYMAPETEYAEYKRWNSAPHTRHIGEKAPCISHLAVFHLRNHLSKETTFGNVMPRRNNTPEMP